MNGRVVLGSDHAGLNLRAEGSFGGFLPSFNLTFAPSR